MGFDLASVTAAGVGSIMSGAVDLAQGIRSAITGEIPPDKKAELEQLAKQLDNQLIMAQLAVNLEEAKSERIFVAGWRPACGWVGAIALFYASVGEPFLSWCARLYGSTVIFPVIDTTIMFQVLAGMLGLGVLRTVDKAQSPSPKGKE
jgi:hypothetical protein